MINELWKSCGSCESYFSVLDKQKGTFAPAMEFFLNFSLLFSWVEQMLNLEFEKEIFSHDMTVYFIFVYSK